MENVLRQRIPWNSGASETTPLLEEEAGIELESLGAEEGALYTFESIEAAGAALDSSVIGLPEGLAIGALGLLGYGAYEIYDYFAGSGKEVKIQEVHKHIQTAKQNQQQGKNIYGKPYTNKGEEPYAGEPTVVQDIYAKDGQYSDAQGYVVPPFKYLGPGNSLDRGKPYNNIDEDARQHDNEYYSAKSDKDIYNSDTSFISKASDHLIEGISGKGSISDTIGAAIGGIGIGVKHVIEKNTGVLYPSKLWPLQEKESIKIIKLGTIACLTMTNNIGKRKGQIYSKMYPWMESKLNGAQKKVCISIVRLLI